MTCRRLVALWVSAAALAAPVGAIAGQKRDTTVPRNRGKVIGYVLDCETGRPIPGARVVVAEDGAFAQGGSTTGATDTEGRYRVSARIGRRSSHLDLMSVVEGFPIALFMPWGLFKKTSIVDVHECLMKVEAPGYKPFLGTVAAQVTSAKRFALHSVDVLMARQGSQLASTAPPDRPRESLLSYSIEPQIAAPGEKVTFTARFRLPNDGVQYTAGWYTADKLFRFDDFPMKTVGGWDPETGTRTFAGKVEIPKKVQGEWAAFRPWLDRDRKYNEVEFPGAKEVLLQVVRTPEERQAAQAAREAFDLEQMDRPADALARYRQAAEASPGRPSLWARIGYLNLQLNRPREAVAAYEKLIAADPGRPEATTAQYANALLAAGETQRALDALVAVEKKGSKGRRLPREFLLAMARTYLERDDLKSADDYYGRAVKIGRVPNEVAQQFHLERARAAVRQSPQDPDAYAALARALFDLKRYEEAAVAHREAIRLAPGSVWGYLDVAACLTAAGRDGEALAYYRQAVAVAPENLDARLGLAECCRRQGDFASALDAYRKVAAAPARRYDFRAQHGLALALLAAGENKPAMEVLARAVVLARDKGRIAATRIFTGMGLLSLTPKRVTVDSFEQPEAALDYKLLNGLRALERNPEDPVALFEAGSALIGLGVAEKGLALLEKATAHGFAPADVGYVRAMAYLALDRRTEARGILEGLLREDPHPRRALLALARLSFDAGDTASGQTYLVRAEASRQERR